MGRVISAYIKDREILEWLEKKIEDQTFRNVSHAVTVALKLLKEEMDKKEKSKNIENAINF